METHLIPRPARGYSLFKERSANSTPWNINIPWTTTVFPEIHSTSANIDIPLIRKCSIRAARPCRVNSRIYIVAHKPERVFRDRRTVRVSREQQMESKGKGSEASPGELLKVSEVSRLLGVSVRTVWRLVSTGQLPKPLCIGRCRRWQRKDVEQFVTNLAMHNH